MVTKLRNSKLLCLFWLLLCSIVFFSALKQYSQDSLAGYFSRQVDFDSNPYAEFPATTAVVPLPEDSSESYTIAYTAVYENENSFSAALSSSGYTGYTDSVIFLVCAGLLMCITGGFFFHCFRPKLPQELFLLLFLSGFLQLLGDSLCVIICQRFGKHPWLPDLLFVSCAVFCAAGGLMLLWSWNQRGLHGSLLGDWLYQRISSKSLPKQLLSVILTALLSSSLLTLGAVRIARTLFPGSGSSKKYALLLTVFALSAFTVTLLFFLAGPHSIAADMDALVQESIRTTLEQEKLKVDLITNISHDLKTPLTSIIGYGEQLSDQELSPAASSILNKLQHKSRYLLEMVEEVFELSKASSGHLSMKQEVIDLGRLLDQTLGEMDEELCKSCFELKRDYPQTGMMVCCDGLHMHRVFQNLFDNALKYACPKTRIFIHASSAADGFCEVRIRNISSVPLDFDPVEITERFVRGEKARTGEGSGLGLAIVKTYTEACGGQFRLELEDDMFTAVILLPSVTNERDLKDFYHLT